MYSVRGCGSSPFCRRTASAWHTGTGRGSPPGGAYSISVTDGPWRGSKKHGGRPPGGGPGSRGGGPALRVCAPAPHLVAAVGRRLGHAAQLLDAPGAADRFVCALVVVER